jgi:hypothetical protein
VGGRIALGSIPKSKEEKIEINKELIGKTVSVMEDGSFWVGEVIDVKNENTLLVKESNMIHEVDIFDIRETR